MISVDTALQRILAQLEPVGTEIVPVSAGFGRVLGADLIARRTQPDCDVSSMDGYALRAADISALPVRLKLVGQSRAGAGFDGVAGPGEAVRIFTGARLPAGLDTIALQEDARPGDGHVEIGAVGSGGRYIRRAGLDFRAGDVGLRAGRRLTARDVALAAAMDQPWLAVRRRPRVAILPTGDEIAMPGETLGPDRIPSANGLGIAAMVEAAGGIPIQLGIARDEPEHLRRLAGSAAGADLLVTIGGASVGDYDLVQSALAEMGLAVDFWQIAMRPGKPLMWGRLGSLPLLGLPGNPVSALVCAILFLRPALARLQGDEPAGPPPRLEAVTATALAENDRRQDYLRANLERRADGTLLVRAAPVQDSSMLALFAAADCLIVRPPLAPAVPAFSRVSVIPLD